MTPPSGLDRVETALDRQLRGDARRALWLLLVGLLSGAAAFLLWNAAGPERAARWVLASGAGLEVLVGAVVWARAPWRGRRLRRLLRSDPAAFHAEEADRVRRALAGFARLRSIEIAALLVGLGGAASTGHPQFKAAGTALLIQAGVLLAFDLVAEWRAGGYLRAVRQLIPGRAAAGSGQLRRKP